MATLVAAGIIAQPIRAADPLPRCGVPRLEPGDGFHATLYMFAGSPEFTLTYDVPASAITLNGASLGRPPQIIIFAIDEPAAEFPRLHIDDNLDLHDERGNRINSFVRHVECGNGATLDTHELVPPPAQVRACFEAMRETGGYRVSLSRREGDPPFLVLAGQWPLRATVAAVRATWHREIERFRIGACRLMEPPPPVF